MKNYQLPLTIQEVHGRYCLSDDDGVEIDTYDQASEAMLVREQLTRILQRRRNQDRGERGSMHSEDNTFREPAIGDKLAFGFRMLGD